jgi:ferric-dicitrate binding protein FerR (iron transport regulator)
MAASPASSPLPNPPRLRLRRWLVGIVALLALLAVYAVALRWVTKQVGDDVQNSFREVPVLDDHTPRTN